MSSKTYPGSTWSCENDLVESALDRIRNRAGIIASAEVPILGRSVDLCYIEDGFVVTVEFKLRDWRRAVVQARDHLLGADFAYICMPKRSVSEVLREEFDRAGVGLFFFREDGKWPFETVIEAPKSQETWIVARSAALEHIKSSQGTGDDA